MTWEDQIKVTRIAVTNNDLFPANVARVSFDNWHEEFITRAKAKKLKLKSSDEGLLSYLAKHQHTSPFRHARETFIFPELPFTFAQLTPFDIAGMAWEENTASDNQMWRIRHSVYGWANMLNKGQIHAQYADSLREQLVRLYPHCMQALVQDVYTSSKRQKACLHYPAHRKETNPWFKDVSVRCTAPIHVARQAVKHQVMMSWNEVSRRYVDYPVELFEQEFRVKPEGSIKQGSGDVTDDVPMFYAFDNEGEDRFISVQAMRESMLEWYNECINSGLAPETIRGELPLNLQTTWIWTGCMASWQHFLDLRQDGHAQKEIQVFADKIAQVLS